MITFARLDERRVDFKRDRNDSLQILKNRVTVSIQT
jgi:hypothetical protein